MTKYGYIFGSAEAYSRMKAIYYYSRTSLILNQGTVKFYSYYPEFVQTDALLYFR